MRIGSEGCHTIWQAYTLSLIHSTHVRGCKEILNIVIYNICNNMIFQIYPVIQILYVFSGHLTKAFTDHNLQKCCQSKSPLTFSVFSFIYFLPELHSKYKCRQEAETELVIRDVPISNFFELPYICHLVVMLFGGNAISFSATLRRKG